MFVFPDMWTSCRVFPPSTRLYNIIGGSISSKINQITRHIIDMGQVKNNIFSQHFPQQIKKTSVETSATFDWNEQLDHHYY